jgi:hypothetical protein
MTNLSRDIREADVENRRNYIWANVASLGVLGLMIVFLLLSNGGAPRQDSAANSTASPPYSQARPNG